MTERLHPRSTSDCIALLQDVLMCLDSVCGEAAQADAEPILLAAGYVQQSIEILKSVEGDDA